MTSQRSFPTRFALRFFTGLLALALMTAAVAGLSPASEPDPKPKAEPPAAKPSDKPRPPEEEEPNAHPVKNHKVTVEEGDAPAPKTAPAPRPVDLRQAARDAKNIPTKNLFHELEVAHDVMTRTYPNRAIQDIVPIPDYIGHNTDAITEPFKVTPFRHNSWIPEDPVEVKKNYIESIKPYEEVALTAVDAFLKENYESDRDPQKQMTRYDQDVAAEQVLTTALLGLQSDRRRGRRAGGAWQDVENKLKQRLFSVLLEELNLLVKKGDWEPAFALTKRLAETYSAPEEQTKIAQPLAGLIYAALTHATDEKQKAEARQRLRLMEDLFPDNQVLDDSARVLRDQASELIAKANRELERGDPKKDEVLRTRIGKLLNEAEGVDPNAPGIRNLRITLMNERPTLRVGVRELPAQMSPALAGSDSDLRAVELMFESLMKLHSDGDGGSRWEPGLAEGPPRMMPRGRQFQLALDGQWSNGKRITAVDVRDTVGLLKDGKIAARPPAWGDLLDKVFVVGEASRVNLTLPQGWLDPLALMNFKVVPSGSAPESAAFLAEPVGSGPFVYDDKKTTEANKEYRDNKEEDRKCKVFVFNPHYGARPGKTGLPHIDEIRFILYSDAAAEMGRRVADRCDLMLDLTAKEAADVQAKAAVLGMRQPPIASANRRIHFLAVNHRNPVLANAAFRRALAYAVHRDELLDDFRATPGQELHSPLNGPYPAKSWACNPKLAQENGNHIDPFNIEKAKASMVQANKEGVRDPGLTLKYPAGDAAVEKAMKSLCEKVSAEINITLKPVAVPPAELRRDVETTYSYDLAYYHYDFPDDVYWLGPLLDPRGGPGDQNYMGYSGGGPGDLIPLMREISRRRDFPEVQKYAYILHDNFLKEEMPFIPLWQLDALSAISKRVEIPQADLPFDPVRVFTDVERWRLKGE
jgi:peptide/nickel transport system substrate-binding protein